MLTIAIHGNGVISLSLLQSRGKGSLMSEIPAEMNCPDRRVFSSKTFDDLSGFN